MPSARWKEALALLDDSLKEDEARRAKMRCLLVAALLVSAGCANISKSSVRRPSPPPTNQYESRAPRLELLKLAPDTRVRVSSVQWHTPVIGPLAVASERAVSIWSVNSERRIEIPMTEVSTIHANPELKSNASKMASQGVWGGLLIGVGAAVLYHYAVDDDEKDYTAVEVGVPLGVGWAIMLGTIGGIVGLGEDAWELVYDRP